MVILYLKVTYRCFSKWLEGNLENITQDLSYTRGDLKAVYSVYTVVAIANSMWCSVRWAYS
jgi:hypothetical protein